MVHNSYSSPTALTETIIWQSWQLDYLINARGPEIGVSSRLDLNLFQDRDKFTNYFIINFNQIVMNIIQVFWNVVSFRLLNNNQRFREAYCLHLQGLTPEVKGRILLRNIGKSVPCKI